MRKEESHLGPFRTTLVYCPGTRLYYQATLQSKWCNLHKGIVSCVIQPESSFCLLNYDVCVMGCSEMLVYGSEGWEGLQALSWIFQWWLEQVSLKGFRNGLTLSCFIYLFIVLKERLCWRLFRWENVIAKKAVKSNISLRLICVLLWLQILFAS